MKRLRVIFLAVLFVTTTLIIPSIHRNQCAHEQTEHDSDHCPICQIAHAPVLFSPVSLTTATSAQTVDTAIPAFPVVPPSVSRSATQARAPPA